MVGHLKNFQKSDFSLDRYDNETHWKEFFVKYRPTPSKRKKPKKAITRNSLLVSIRTNFKDSNYIFFFNISRIEIDLSVIYYRQEPIRTSIDFQNHIMLNKSVMRLQQYRYPVYYLGSDVE